MTTKRSEKSCKIPSGRKPTRRQYDLAVLNGWDVLEVYGRVLFRKRRTKAIGDPPVPPPHDWPPYGGLCWQQAYPEMMALQILASAWNAWVAATSGSYSPPQSVINALYAAYIAARQNYVLAWGAMEDCLSGQQV